MKKKAVNNESDEFEADEPEEFEESGSDWAPEEEAPEKKRRGRPKAAAKKPTPAKKQKVEKKPPSDEEDDEDEEEEEEDEEGEDSEESESEPAQIDGADLLPYSNGSFVVQKGELKDGNDPPLWKIDGKALLQKFIPFEQDGKQLYKSTSTYSGWTQSNRTQYAPAPVNFVIHTKKETVIEFLRDQVDLTSTPSKDDNGENS